MNTTSVDDTPAASDTGPVAPEPLVLRTPAHFKALGHPVRHSIINVLRQRPATLGQLAAAMGLAKGTISFHVRVLREAGLVRLAGTQHVRGGTEQHFALVSTGFRLDEEAGSGSGFLVQAALAEMLPADGGESGHTVLRHLWLSQQQARALAAQLEDFATRQHPADAVFGEAYGLLLSLYRADIPKLPAAE
ncbi:MAG TPA: metalloregulator ArsR/SmtB family transcription factor [Streptosporangiaceae bacterium]